MNRKRFMSAGVFQKLPRIDDSRLAGIFSRDVMSCLVGRELLSPDWAERLLSWPRSGFNVHGGRGPRLCLGIHFRRTRPWIRTRASGEPKARPWQPGPGQDEAGGRTGGDDSRNFWGGRVLIGLWLHTTPVSIAVANAGHRASCSPECLLQFFRQAG